MGFYDQTDGQANRKQTVSPVLISILSAVIGGAMVLLAIPSLVRSGLLALPSEGQSPRITGPTVSAKVQVTSTITEAVKKAQPAIVAIINMRQSNDPFNPDMVQQGTGSGIIFEKSGDKARIVTNYHVIENGTRLKVVLPGEDGKKQEVDARVLGSDPITDLAVLEIDGRHVTSVAEFGDSDTLQAGEPAIAIGNPLGLGQSVSVGVISSPRRTIDVNENMSTDVIQTDAAINPGNSGGALLNIAGQVVGINTLKIAERGVEGLGFAIPSNDARPIIENLIRHGEVPRPYMGVGLVDLQRLSPSVWAALDLPDTVTGGVVVRNVDAGYPADLAGLRTRDVIVALDNQPVNNGSELRRYLYKNKKIGDTLNVTFYRDGQKRSTTMKLVRAPRGVE
ncbi:S1C family serine protease [Staphylospora marina]|uniref:S1C family serine protease n=1 Tax=Staphylospora marina TaxID=2490858 RepID=UPI000F5BB93F|nr:S1C family serine protease [Staphylospora marina]